MYKNFRKAKFGVFLKDKPGVFLNKNTSEIEFSFKHTQIDKNTLILQLRIKNTGKDNFEINSLVISDLVLADLDPDEVLENAWTQSGFSGYRKGIPRSKRSMLFLMRDQNPFSYRSDYGYLNNSLVSEWYTQLLCGQRSLVIGAISVRRQFTQIFVRKEKKGTRVRITCQLDGLEIAPDETFESEKIAVLAGEKRKTLEDFAILIKRENDINVSNKPVKGLCCAYYYQGNMVDEKYILEQLDAIDSFADKPSFDVIQIDGLPTPWGDWMESLEKLFPSGLENIVKKINKSGFKAGFWIAPFVANPSSNLFKNHPDWFLKNEAGKFFEARFTSPFDFLPQLSFRVLDPTNPEVDEHISDIIRKLVGYGFEYIKTDFTYPVCFATGFAKSMTRAQALRIGFETIRKAAGKDVLVQTAITQLSPVIGTVDYCRPGLDTLTPYVCKIPLVRKLVNEHMLRENLRNCETRNFLHNKVWISDPDCIVFRSGTGIGESLISDHKRFVYKNKTSLWVGDNLSQLTEEQKRNLSAFLRKF